MIKYGMSLDYLPDWGVSEALREIFQNFQDFGEFEKKITPLTNDLKRLYLENNYKPNSLEFLKIGCSGKRNDSSSVGEHGEGLKMALMVISREGYKVQVQAGNTLLDPTTYIDADLGECFGINKTYTSIFVPFSVLCDIPVGELALYEDSQLKPEDILHSSFNGQLLKNKPGQVYVGGLYVCTEKNLRHGYNFNPEDVKLDRDRSVPRTWDVDYHAARILEAYREITEEDLESRDGSLIYQIPEKLQKKFKPRLTKSGDVLFETKKGTIANQNISKDLLRKPGIQKKIEKLKYNMTTKRVPRTILQEFYDKHKTSMNNASMIDFKVLIAKAKTWKVEK